MKTEIAGIDILKLLAVTAVILIHAFPNVVVLNQICRFSVPLFVALSGYGLVMGYSHKSLNLVDFFRKRLLRLLPWYLFFATLDILTITYIFHQNTAIYRDLPLWKLYVLGRADIHLYFVPMIFQLYLLFPLLFFLFKKIRSIYLVVLALLWQIGWYFLITQKTEILSNNNSLWPDYQQYVYFTSWIFYFVLGMYLAKTKRFLIIGFLATIVGLIWSVGNSLNLTNFGINIIVTERFTRLPVLMYATGVIILSCNLINLIPNIKILTRLGKFSYIIYLGHTLVLRLIYYVL